MVSGGGDGARGWEKRNKKDKNNEKRAVELPPFRMCEGKRAVPFREEGAVSSFYCREFVPTCRETRVNAAIART